MNVRTIHSSLVVVCAIGLAFAGFGWRTQSKPAQSKAAQQVYCNIAELEREHPAWGRMSDIELVASGVQIPTGSGAPDVVISQVATSDRSVGPIGRSRSELKARLEQRADLEIMKLNDQLSLSVARQISEKGKELRALSEAADAEDIRQADNELAAKLRQLGESRSPERLDAAIKIAALRSKLAVPGTHRAPIEQSIEELSKRFEGFSDREDALKKDAAASVAAAKARRQAGIEAELAQLKALEDNRITSVIEARRDRLHRELEGKELDTSPVKFNGGTLSKSLKVDSESAARSARGRARMDVASRSRELSAEILADRKSLRKRIDAELMMTVSRIARENGLQVTFVPKSGVQDRTSWFRDRLPYKGKNAHGNKGPVRNG